MEKELSGNMPSENDIEKERQANESRKRADSLYEKRYKYYSFPKTENFDTLHHHGCLLNIKEPTYQYHEKKYTLWETMKHIPLKDKMESDTRFGVLCIRIDETLDKTRQLATVDLIDNSNKAAKQVNNAEKEYGNRAFSLFWQSLENAGCTLELLAFYIYSLNRMNLEYISQVKHLESHYDVNYNGNNFPPSGYKAIPDLTNVTQKYEYLLRQGLSDYEFASIWEMIKTRKTIIAGFQSLESGINSVGELIKDSVINISWQLEKNAREQAHTSAIQNLALYNVLSRK